MAAKEFKLTAERLAELEQELNWLKTVREKEVAELIKEARSFGDLSENSEYDEAKNEQSKLYGRIFWHMLLSSQTAKWRLIQWALVVRLRLRIWNWKRRSAMKLWVRRKQTRRRGASPTTPRLAAQ